MCVSLPRLRRRRRRQVPAGGTHVFYLLANDGGRVLVDGAVVVDTGGPGGYGAGATAWGMVPLERGWHDLQVLFWQGGGAQQLMLLYTYPGASTPTAWPRRVMV